MTQRLSFDKYVLLQFRAGLREQQRDLQETIDRMEKEIRDVSAPTADTMDLSCCSASKEAMAARNNQNHRKLKMVELALERIQDGSFGTCVACDGAIGLKRLQAVPSTSHCIVCQERMEQGTVNVVVSSIPTLEGESMQNSTT
jgi:DnaK suppressor protein